MTHSFEDDSQHKTNLLPFAGDRIFSLFLFPVCSAGRISIRLGITTPVPGVCDR